MIIPNFSQKLSAALRLRGMMQKELAERCNVTERHLSRVKKDSRNIVPDKLLQAICNALGVGVDYFYEDVKPNTADYFPVPFRDAGGGMGGGYEVGSRRINSYISIRTDYLRHRTNNLENLSFVHASGESMCPTIPADTSVLIDEGQTEAINNKIFYIMLNGKYYIKRLEVVDERVTAIISDNGNIREEIGEGDSFEILGRAIMQLGDL